jgi:hypothetical protein
LPVSPRRRSALFGTLVAACLVLALLPASVIAKEPPGLNRFMNAVGKIESNGRYNARNSRTGAIGKYQVMPSNWPAWAKKYLGHPKARPTAENQERVARGKFIDLFNWLGSWPAVAHWWLTGSGERNPSKWSSGSASYVAKVMKIMASASDKAPDPPKDPVSAKAPPPPLPPTPPAAPAGNAVYQDSSPAIVWAGAWSSASYPRYAGGTVRYATSAGARASLAFTGKSISWIGPVGPTRGRARVYVDGKFVGTIDLRASRFAAHRTLFSTSWSRSATHTLSIQVVAAAGRPVVAIDELVVAR